MATSAVDPNGYFVDTLFRSDRPATDSRDLSGQAETGRIFAHAMQQNEISPADKNYLAGLIAAKTGISGSDAEKRVSDVMANAMQAEDTARKVTAHMLLWIFLTLLMGAFSASFAATIGGRQRDHVNLV